MCDRNLRASTPTKPGRILRSMLAPIPVLAGKGPREEAQASSDFRTGDCGTYKKETNSKLDEDLLCKMFFASIEGEASSLKETKVLPGEVNQENVGHKNQAPTKKTKKREKKRARERKLEDEKSRAAERAPERAKQIQLGSDSSLDQDHLYRVLSRKFLLTEQELVDNGFPRPDPREKEKAIIKSDPRRIKKKEPDKRWCDRCWSEYVVDEQGKQVTKENCIYHLNRGHSCCQRGPKAKGCQVNKFHCTDIPDYNNLRGFVTTEGGNNGSKNSGKVFAVDCEMCNTTEGREVTRVTVIDYTGTIIYESLVNPENEVLDYNTRFSGITKEDLDGVTTILKDVQAVLLTKFNCNDILIGHGLNSDLKALKLLHNKVVDTSVVFLQEINGRKFKKSLKDLSKMYINRIIQSGSGGHDSTEDALAALDIMKMKVRKQQKRKKK